MIIPSLFTKTVLFTLLFISFYSSYADFDKEKNQKLLKRYSGEADLPADELQRRLDRFSYSNKYSLKAYNYIKTRDEYDLFEGFLTVPYSGQDSKKDHLCVRFNFYRAHQYQEGPTPLLLYFPSIVGMTPMHKIYAKYFASRGISFAVVHFKESVTNFSRKSEDLDPLLVREMIRSQIFLDWAVKNPQIDANKIGILGVSLGGIRGALLMGVDVRVKAATIVVGGVNLPEILAFGDQFIVKRYRRYRMSIERLKTTKEYHRKLKNLITLDPMYFIKRRNPKDFLLLVAKYDKTVPAKNQYQLWDLAGRPKKIVFYKSHIPTAMLSPLYMYQMLKFFNLRWSEDKEKL